MLDVNLNRLGEALKFIEDYSRYLLNNRMLLARVRRIRNQYRRIRRNALAADSFIYRNSEQDPGRGPAFDRVAKTNAGDLLRANFNRAKESARTLEELFKIHGTSETAALKQIRFAVYDVEKTALELAGRQFDPRLCVIFDEKYFARLARRQLEAALSLLQDRGATMIQLRARRLNDRALFQIAVAFRKAIARPAVKFIVNNRLDIALACGADGVHVGPDDLPVTAVRRIAGHLICGYSAQSLRAAQSAARAGADYIGVGALFKTATKPDARQVGLATLGRIARHVSVPVIGIGGVTAANCNRVFKAGAKGIAIAGYLFEGSLAANLCALTKTIK